jgi:hypothetical protein
LIDQRDTALARGLLERGGGADDTAARHGVSMLARHGNMTRGAHAAWLVAGLLALVLGIVLGAAWHKADERARSPGPARPAAVTSALA